MEDSGNSEEDDIGALAQSTASIGSAASAGNRQMWRWRRKVRLDLEHIDPGRLRKMALALAIYGMVVMTVCLVMNIFFTVARKTSV